MPDSQGHLAVGDSNPPIPLSLSEADLSRAGLQGVGLPESGLRENLLSRRVDEEAPIEPWTDDLQLLTSCLEVIRFSPGECIFRMGSPAGACYFIEEGEVRVEVEEGDLDSGAVLTYLSPGSLLGELGFLDGQPRSATAWAQNAVTLRIITPQALENLTRSHPGIALRFVNALAKGVAQKLRSTSRRLAEKLAGDSSHPDVDDAVARAVQAQQTFGDWTDERVDGLLLALATAFAENAEELARLTVRVTRIGNVRDKTQKNKFASLGIYRLLAGQITRGPLSSDPERKVIEFGSPVGVIFALVPMTNPVATAAFKTLISLKARNALILSFHRTCQRVADSMGGLILEVLRSHGAPLDLVQCVRDRKNRRITERFMRHRGVSMILATGGTGMVRAAYSSGKPAIGVGQGNAPALICADADPQSAARKVVMSKSFDNGLICGAEHHLVVDALVRDRFVEALEQYGAAVLGHEETQRFRSRVIDASGKAFRSDIVGQTAQTIAERTGIFRPFAIRLLVVPSCETSPADPFFGEKLAPLLSLFTVRDHQHGVKVCRALLAHEGAGHTAIIHSRSDELIESFSKAMPAGRILVNAPGSHGSGGMTTGLDPSFVLGCGTFGGNSTTDNITFRHLLNIKRVAHHLESKESELTSAGLLDPCEPWETKASA